MTATFYIGDALEVMATLPEKSVDLVLSSPPFLALRSYLPADHPDKAKEGGSQATPGEYIDWLVDVAEACARVLAPHGSLCFELGDTYAASGGAGGDYDLEGLREGQPKFRQIFSGGWPLPKSLSLIPELFRFSLVYGFNPLTGKQTERWRLRNVVDWVRPNPPVGALGDKFRPATSELMVFCKSAKRYFDLDAVREAHSQAGLDRANYGYNPEIHDPRDNRDTKQRATQLNPIGAPPLDWWNIPPGGYEGAHYAVFPPELCVRPIKAMCPETVCRTCGEPRRRITESERIVEGRVADKDEPTYRPDRGALDQRPYTRNGDYTFGKQVTTLGFSDCGHNNYRPGLVLDPFAGSGTTLAVASGHGRDSIGIDLDERNFDLALERVGPLMLEKGVLA